MWMTCFSFDRWNTSKVLRTQGLTSTCHWIWSTWCMPGEPRLWSVSRNTGSCCTSTRLWLTMWGCAVPKTPTNCRVRWLQSVPGMFPCWFWCKIDLLQLETAGSMCLSSSWGINNGYSPLIMCRNETFILLGSGTMCVITLHEEIKLSRLWVEKSLQVRMIALLVKIPFLRSCEQCKPFTNWYLQPGLHLGEISRVFSQERFDLWDTCKLWPKTYPLKF